MIRLGVPVAVWWSQRDGKGVWRVKELRVDSSTEAFHADDMIEASSVELRDAVTRVQEDGNRALPGGPRGWIEGILVRHES